MLRARHGIGVRRGHGGSKQGIWGGDERGKGVGHRDCLGEKGGTDKGGRVICPQEEGIVASLNAKPPFPNMDEDHLVQ